MATVADIKKDLKELRRDMKANGIKKTSPFNGGLDMDTYRANARRFALETQLADAVTRAAAGPEVSPT
jgi:hypothetical protein